MPHRVAILGSTGSIGVNALEVLEHLGAPYRAIALSAHGQAQKLLEQAKRHRPAAVALTDGEAARGVVTQLEAMGTRVYTGNHALAQLVERDDVDTVVAAIVGAAGLPAALAAVKAGKRLALANKESLVVAGSLLIPEARRRGIALLPVDSEHSAVFQAMQCGRLGEVRRVILTASGGPFRTMSREAMDHATLESALAHPTWRMGGKITIDSATMFNKALEIIEACWLFDLPPERVQVMVHPESIVHSMVEYVDGSVMAQLSPPDMRTPIQYALTWPERRDGIGRVMNFDEQFDLHFEPPDPQRFPALRLAYVAARAGGTMGAVMNAANETAVEAFVAGNLPFGGIWRVVELTMDGHCVESSPTLDDLLRADRESRQAAQSLLAEVADKMRTVRAADSAG